MKDIAISWTKPNFKEESDEYFKNENTRRWLAEQGLVFKTVSELLEYLTKGRLEVVSKETLLRHNRVNFILTPEELERSLEDADFASAYRDMEKELTTNSPLVLQAPIILIVSKYYYCFSGCQQASLAFNYGIALRAWVVRTRKATR